MKRLIFIPLLILWAQAAVAASPTIVDGDYVAAAIARNAVVWDVRPVAAYARRHIAGAINVGDAAKVLRDENTEDFIATDRIEKILGAGRSGSASRNHRLWQPRHVESLFRSLHLAVFRRQQCPRLP